MFLRSLRCLSEGDGLHLSRIEKSQQPQPTLMIDADNLGKPDVIRKIEQKAGERRIRNVSHELSQGAQWIRELHGLNLALEGPVHQPAEAIRIGAGVARRILQDRRA